MRILNIHSRDVVVVSCPRLQREKKANLTLTVLDSSVVWTHHTVESLAPLSDWISISGKESGNR
jgi:hypothetical protein